MELLAPNGKPSNLTPEQYKLVRTTEFKKWFGDWENDPENSSKVVDENGEPMVVYHGTNQKFTIFSLEKVGSNVDYGMWGNGFYFSPSRKFSKNYGTNLLKVFLDIKNPFVKNPNLTGNRTQFKPVFGKEESINLRNQILNANYDGVMQWESGQKNPLTQIVTFYPNQIKLADGTNTTFDSNNPDIRYANGGEVYENKQIYKKWKSLVNMTKTELEKFYNSEEGKEAGLTPSEAKEKGIDSGRESARWIMKMKDTPISEWTNSMWRWAKKQISFISRMRGNKGGLYDENGNKTRKHTSLLIWGHNPVKNKFNNGGQLLLAPNGESSNLTSEQYKLVRTSEFKAWFGDWENDPENSSKVLDENGEPMVCYHGTNRDFSVFDIKEIGQGSGNLGHYGYGFYFSEDIIEAKVYGSNILKCFLKIKNPFLNINENFDLLKKYGFFGIDEKVAISIDFNDFYNKIALIDGKAYEFVKIAKEKGLDNVWDIYLENNNSSDSTIDLNSLYDILLYTDLFKQNDYKVPDYVFTEIEEIGIQPKLNYDYEFEQSLHWVTNLGENSKEVTNVIKSLGFDGIIVGSEFVLFESSQIKLADGLNTTFDMNNPDIRFENGGNVYENSSYEDMTNFTLDVKKIIEDSGYYVSNPSYSKTKFGNSNYLYVSKDILDENNIKVRISDHSVTNLDRMFNEIHIHYPNYKGILGLNTSLKEIDFRLNKSKFFKSDEGYEYYPVIMEVNENGLRDNDEIISERLSSAKRGAGRRIFNIKRINKKNVINWIDIRDGKIFKTINKYINGGQISFDNFYKNTFANFIEISENEIPNREPDFISDWNSKYWYEDDYVIRQSDHWGKLDTCIWLLNMLSINKLTQGKCKLSDFKIIDENNNFKDGGQLNKDLIEKAIIEDIIINPNEEYSEFVNEKAIDYVLLFPKYQNLTKEEALFIYKYFSNYENLIDKNGNYIAQIKWNYVYGSNNKDAKKDDELLRKFIEKMDKHGIIVFDYYNSVIEADKAVIDFINAVRDRIKTIVSNVIYKNNDSELEELNLLIELTEDTLKENESDEELQMYLELLKDTKEQLIESKNNKLQDGGSVPFDKLISASSRFKPSETVLFDPPLEGKNGAKLISYTWSYEWTMTPNYEGELKSKRVSDWSQAEISADTGRDIVHQYTVLMPDGEYKTVSSDSVPILLGYIDRKELKSFPNLVTASKTLAKQQMQLAIMEAQKKEYDELYSKFEKAEKPEIKEVEETSKFSAAKESWEKGAYSNYSMGDIIYRQDNDYVYETKEYKKRPITKDTIEQLTSFWISKRVEEAGGINPRGLYDLKNRVARQKRKVENILSAKMENGGEMEDFDWESLYNPSPEEQKIRDEEHKKSLEREKEDWYQNTKFSKKWAATYKDAVNRTVKEYLDAKATYDDWASRQYKQNKGMVFLGGDDVFGEAKSIGSINEGRRQRVLRGSKMQMDESIETLKELGLSENEINDLIQNKKMANGGEINNYSDKVKFLINKYGNMSFDEFKQYATSYHIESYDDIKTWSNRDYMVIDKYPIIIKVFNTNGYNIELRKSDEKLKYVAVDKNGNIIRDDRGLALYQSDEELISKGIPLYDSSIYAFHEGKNIGFISNSWNVPELFVRPEYQKLGIGTELLWQYLIQDNGYFMDNKGFLGQYTSQGIIAIKKLHKRFVEESKMLV